MPYVGRTPSAVPVTADDIPANSIDASKIVDGAIAVADIGANAVGSSELIDNAVTDAKIADATIVNLKSGRKNLLINGGFDVWQRGTSFSSPATTKYTADRWKVMGTVTTVSKVTNGLSITATSSDSFMQDIEAMNVKAGNYIFSFTADDYSKITNIGCYSMGGGTHYGYATKLSDGVYSINLAEINRAGSSIRFEFYLAVGTVVLSQVQLELGSVATDFEHRSFGEELALCQRYYEKSFPYATAPANGSNTTSFSTNAGKFITAHSNNSDKRDDYKFRVEKRSSPTMGIYGNSAGRWYSYSTGWHQNNHYVAADSTGFQSTQQATGSIVDVQGHWTADAEL
jgi:hypothetical protein